MKKGEKKKWAKHHYHNKKFYTLRAVLGIHDINWYCLLGSRERGKTFTVQDYVLNSFFDKKSPLYHVPFHWFRLNDVALKNMTANNCAKMFEPILVRKYHLEGIKLKADTVYIGTKPLCHVRGLATAYNDKGSAMFDAHTFKGVNVVVDEMAFEKDQKRTCDPMYNLQMQVENVCRHERKNVKIFIMMNNTEECPEVLATFGFIPLKFGIYRLKRKHCVIDYAPNTEGYQKMRKDSLANEIDNGSGNFTNKVQRDVSLIKKQRLLKPVQVIKFDKYPESWFTVWNGNHIVKYKNEHKPVVAMKRYIDEVYMDEMRDMIVQMADMRNYTFDSMKTYTLFYKELSFIQAE